MTFSPGVLLVTVGGLIVGVLLFVAVMNAISSGEARSPVGTDLYELGDADSLGATIEDQGPLLLQDLLSSKRAIYVQYLGGTDWRTFDTRPPDAAPDCLVEWQPERRVFVDRCSSDRVYPADGTGLTTFPTRVGDDGKVLIDLRNPQPPATTTTTTTPPDPTTTVAPEPDPTAPAG